MVYVTKLEDRVATPGRPWTRGCRLVADAVDELHAMATRLGLKHEWVRRDGRRGVTGSLYYEIPPGKRREALIAGAVDLHTRELEREIGGEEGIWH